MALMTWGGAPAQQGAASYVDTPTGRMEVPRVDSYAQQQAQAQWAQMAANAANQQPQYAVTASPGSGPVIGGTGGSTSSLNANSILSQYLNGAGGSPTPPTLQLPNMPTAPNYSASGSASITNPYDAQIRQLVAQLQGQAAQSDSALSDRANQQIAAQRAVLDRRANQDVQRSLAQNGLLPTGGLAARMREQISRPYEESLAASAADINANMRSQRDATANNLISSLSNIQNASATYALDQQRLQQQAARDQWQMQVDRYNQEAAANQTAYSRALDAYNMNLQQQDRARAQQARQQAAYQDSSGGGYASGGGGGGYAINAGQNSFLEQGTQPRDLYQNMVNQQRASEARNYNRGMADRFNAGNGSTGNGYTFTGNTGNGVSSAGSYTGISMNGPLVGSVGGVVSGAGQQAAGGYGGSSAYNTAMGIGGIVGGAGQQLGGTLGSYANSNYSRSMY